MRLPCSPYSAKVPGYAGMYGKALTLRKNMQAESALSPPLFLFRSKNSHPPGKVWGMTIFTLFHSRARGESIRSILKRS